MEEWDQQVLLGKVTLYSLNHTTKHISSTSSHWHIDRTSEWVTRSQHRRRSTKMFRSVAESTKSTSIERSNLNASRGNWQKWFYFHSPEFQFTGTDGLDPGYCHTGIVWFTIEGNQISRWNVSQILGINFTSAFGKQPTDKPEEKVATVLEPVPAALYSKSRVTPCSSLGHRQRQTSILDSGLHLLNHILESTISPMCMFGV